MIPTPISILLRRLFNIETRKPRPKLERRRGITVIYQDDEYGVMASVAEMMRLLPSQQITTNQYWQVVEQNAEVGLLICLACTHSPN